MQEVTAGSQALLNTCLHMCTHLSVCVYVWFLMFWLTLFTWSSTQAHSFSYSYKISSFSFSSSWASSMCSKAVQSTDFFCRWPASLEFDIMSDQCRFQFVLEEEKCAHALPNCLSNFSSWLSDLLTYGDFRPTARCRGNSLPQLSLWSLVIGFSLILQVFTFTPVFPQLLTQSCKF